jgi:hypothetical protein
MMRNFNRYFEILKKELLAPKKLQELDGPKELEFGEGGITKRINRLFKGHKRRDAARDAAKQRTRMLEEKTDIVDKLVARDRVDYELFTDREQGVAHVLNEIMDFEQRLIDSEMRWDKESFMETIDEFWKKTYCLMRSEASSEPRSEASSEPIDNTQILILKWWITTVIKYRLFIRVPADKLPDLDYTLSQLPAFATLCFKKVLCVPIQFELQSKHLGLPEYRYGPIL